MAITGDRTFPTPDLGHRTKGELTCGILEAVNWSLALNQVLRYVLVQWWTLRAFMARLK